MAVLTVKSLPGSDKDADTARAMLHPTVQAALTALSYPSHGGGVDLTLDTLVAELRQQCDNANNGDLQRAEAMLIAQAHALDAIFGYCARYAARNMAEHLNAAELLLRLGLKAQSQCRATLETLANIKNPPTVFARQANIAHGPQQVNNGVPSPSRPQENRITPNKLLEARDGQRMDIGAASATGCANQELEAVGAIHGAANTRGQDKG